MSAGPPMPLATLERRALPLLLALVTVAFGWILWPFYGPILWGVVIALLFAPLNHALRRRMRRHRTAAAVLTLLTVLVIVVLPVTLVAAALANEAAGVYARIQSGELNPVLVLRQAFAALPEELVALLRRLGLANFDVLQSRLTALFAQGSQFIAGKALVLGQDTVELLIGLFVTFYLAFFLIRDGESIGRAVRSALPLSPEHQNELIGKFATVIRATVKGSLVVALVQGVLGGLAFAVLGVEAALLWAVLMAVLSLVPAVGAGLVWAPVALYLLLSGAVWQGLVLLAWGVFVIGLVDNLLRPVLVGKDTRLPDYLVMISTLGGVVTMGPNGLLIGPAVAAMFIAAWHLVPLSRLPNPPSDGTP